MKWFGRRDADLRDEMEQHVGIETDENIARGMTPEEARDAALRKFGSVSAARETLREERPMYRLETLLQDVRYGVRSLSRSPFLTIAVILTLGLGVGLDTAVFTLVNGMLFRPRIEKNPETFVQLRPEYSEGFISQWFPSTTTLEDFNAYRTRARSVGDFSAWALARGTVENDLEQDIHLLVTCNFFSFYGLERPALGRFFDAQECENPAAGSVVVIPDEMWRARFAADPHIIGRTISLNGRPFTVVGVTPPRFVGHLKSGLWIPWSMQPVFYKGEDFFRKSDEPWLTVEGRLQPGYSVSEANAELSTILSQQDRLHPERRTKLRLTNGSFSQEPGQGLAVAGAALLWMGMLTLLLLLACTNVTMLLLSRGSARKREMATRLALGASRGRILAMLFTEGLILAGAAGLLSAYLAYRVPDILAGLSKAWPYYSVKPDWLVFTYLCCITLVAACMAGLAPAVESLRVDLAASLKGRGGWFGGMDPRSNPRGVLIGVQVAMSLILLIAAGLLARTQYRLLNFDDGLDGRQLLVVRMQSGRQASAALRHRVEQQVAMIPGVRRVSFAAALPVASANVERVKQNGALRAASVNFVTAEYFQTVSIPFLLGGPFAESGYTNGGSPIVVSEKFARSFWPGENPVGKTLEDSKGKRLEVMGVARSIGAEVVSSGDGPLFYRMLDKEGTGQMLVRVAGDPSAVAVAIRAQLREIDPEMVVACSTMRELIADWASRMEAIVGVVLFLGCVAVVLAVTGIYGVVAFSVRNRTKEIGIRVALGATHARIIRSVVVAGVRPVFVGLACGLTISFAGAVGLAKVAQEAPYAIGVFDPLIFVAGPVLLCGAAVAAMFVPARWAAASHPMDALRQD